MKNITLVIIPGPGAQTVEVDENWNIQQLVDSNPQLTNRDIIIDGIAVPQSEWQNTTLNMADEVFATASVKGN